MTQNQIVEFKSDFATICYWYGKIKNQASYVKRLESWDKNGSHENAIQTSLDKLEHYKSKFKEKSKGKTFNEWIEFNKEIKKLKNRVSKTKKCTTHEKWSSMLNNMIWPTPSITKKKVVEDCVHGELITTCEICNYKPFSKK